MSAANPVTRDGLSEETLHELAASLGFTMKPDDEATYYTLLKGLEESVHRIDALPEYTDPRVVPHSAVPLSKRTYTVPEKTDNPLNAWSHKFELKDDKAIATGILQGRSVNLKDTVAVAGVPLTLGTQPSHLSTDGSYPVPTVDGPVVRRIVAAGGVVQGTSVCENYCLSAVSCTSASGPVHNPWLRGYSAGGSTSGAAALVAVKAVRAWREKRGLPVDDLGPGSDLGLGGDQGGSIRLPAAYCGIYGLKPTHGLVPYTGIGSLHPACDHTGPMAASIPDVALFLSAIAGWDGLDPRATPATPLRSAVPAYHTLLEQAIADKQAAGTWTPTAAGRGLRVGVLKEALEHPGLDPHVAAVVRAAAARFAGLGATVAEVSVPLHTTAADIWTAVLHSSMADAAFRNKAPDLPSYALPELAPPPPSQAWYDTMTGANPYAVTALLAAAYLGDVSRFPTRFRNKALTHLAQLRAAYDALLVGPHVDGAEDADADPDVFDVLLLPVTPSVGPRHIDLAHTSIQEKMDAGAGIGRDTMPFNITGHPALSMPGGWAPVPDGAGKLPVGIQLVGRHHNELGIFLAASIWEVGGLGLDNE
ncbi:amidase [Niveomyces insectorum RCEF 264]|uniref:Amidase n=1 Tax=Niveomyces insectorum RCEF 264 TaxID=1081102 RepID=A0A167QDF0_9HYPO|nr:amidase [Niveomyces insectorum RCEF 264]